MKKGLDRNYEELAAIEAKCLGFISYAENHPKYANQRERAVLCSEFEQGKQWTEPEYNRWKEVGIEPIVINRCLTTIKSLAGIYIDNLQDITVIPRKGGSEPAARVLSEIMKHCQDEGGYEMAAFTAFNMGNIQSASYIFLDIDKTKSANGKMVFSPYGFFDVIVDPDCENYDIDAKDSGAKYVLLKKYVDKEELEMIYDKIAKSSPVRGSGFANYVTAVYNPLSNSSTFSSDSEKEYRYCVYIVLWKEVVPALLFGDKKTNQTKILTENIAEYEKKAKGSKRFYTEKVSTCKIHRSVIINQKLMDDEADPYGKEIDFFPGVRFVPLYRPDYERGILDDITSVNREENLRRTQVARLLNSTTNSGWKIKSATDENALTELKQFGSVPGVIIDESKFGGSVEKIEPNQLSVGHITLAQQSGEDVKEITGLNSAVQGYDKGTENDPGIVLKMKKDQGITANEGIFKNFRWTLEILGNKLLKILDSTDIYTPEEIRAIISESHLIDPAMLQKAHDKIYATIGTTLKPPAPIGPPPPELLASASPEMMPQIFSQIQAGIEGAQIYAERYPQLKGQFDLAVKEMAIRMLLDELGGGELNQYGVKVILSPTTPTARMAAFTMMMAIQDKYGVIPPDILLEYSDLPNKDEIISRIKQNMMAQQAMAQRQLPAPAPQQQKPNTQKAVV